MSRLYLIYLGQLQNMFIKSLLNKYVDLGFYHCLLSLHCNVLISFVS